MRYALCVMRILYLITQSEFGGAQRYVFDLAINLKSEFNVIVAAGKDGKNNEFENLLKENRIDFYSIPHLKRKISPLNDLLAIFEILKLIKKLKPDIVHLNSSKVSILGSIVAKICSLYAIYTVHGWVFNEPMPKCKKLFYFLAEKLTSFLKNKIVCISRLDYDIAKSKLRIKEEKLSLIYHGIRPLNFISREEARKKIKERCEMRNAKCEIIIGTIANLYKTKGLEYLIEAVKILMNELRATSYELRAIIIGEGTERKNLENLIKKYNLEKNIFLLGNIKNAAELLPALDIYICSSVKEGFPYSILEAMSAGLPIVSTNVGGIPEIVDDGKNGLLIEPHNPEKLAEKIKILIEDEALRKEFIKEAKKTANEKFKLSEMIKKTKEIYLN